MKEKQRRCAILMAVLLCVSMVSMFFAHRIQTGGGAIQVTEGRMDSPAGELVYKLYVPQRATEADPAPGVLLLHGYQNDHETCAAYAIELARRGAVVLALDEYGHGATQPGLLERGYVDHKVTVNYGQESEADGTYVSIGGQKRYRLMMNFSNLSFFDPYYSQDDHGNRITDSSAGGVAAYAFLAGLPYVDDTALAVSGHSMGTWSSWTVAAAYSGAVNAAGESIEPRAVVLQCGELFRESVYDGSNVHFNNVLLLQAKYDEFSYFRDYQPTVTDELLRSDLRTEFLGCTAAEAAWNTTYGSMADGTARRMELLYTNHRLTTHDSHGLAAAMDWFGQALRLDTGLANDDLVAMGKEWLVLLAMISAVGAMLPLMELLLTTPLFAPLVQPLPDQKKVKRGGKWWTGAIVTMLLGGLSYPFMTQLGHGLLPLPENIFRMTVGNGFLCWYLILILIMLGFTLAGRHSGKKKGTPVTLQDLGLAAAGEPNRFSWGLLGRGALLAFLMAGLVYAVTTLCHSLFLLDLRFIWPFFKTFSAARLGQFALYLPIFALFYLLNNSRIMAAMRTDGTYQPGAKGFWSCWWHNALLMVGGVLLITLIEYVPFFAGMGPGADLLFGSTFGGPFMSLLILFIPQVLAFSLICTYTYRRTGSVYTGAFVSAILSCWIVTGGSSML